MANEGDLICTTCIKDLSFRLATESYIPIITEDEQFYIDDTIIIYELIKIDPLKPTWSDPYGNSVTQYGMVLLGGNGLNNII